MQTKLDINGKIHELNADPRTTLLDALRNHLGLAGSKKGCDHGQCGACTVLINGRRINACLTQCLGGLTFGIGMALTEELVHDTRDGHIVNRDFAEYHLPVSADVPQIKVVLADERDAWANPLQMKGIGELSICGAVASVINAIHNATGVRVRNLPATLDKVLEGL